MTKHLRRRRMTIILIAVIGIAVFIGQSSDRWRVPVEEKNHVLPSSTPGEAPNVALRVLSEIPVKGRAPKTGYTRTQFGNGWSNQQGCDMRNIILARDMARVETNEKCQVTRGVLNDPYTGAEINFSRGPESSQAVQIDHVVALSNAWQTGAQYLTEARRIALANDPLNLLAVEGKANQQKSDSDAASWLPPSKIFRCQYVARQISVKRRYDLWVTRAEKDAMTVVLRQCPEQRVPVEG